MQVICKVCHGRGRVGGTGNPIETAFLRGMTELLTGGMSKIPADIDGSIECDACHGTGTIESFKRSLVQKLKDAWYQLINP